MHKKGQVWTFFCNAAVNCLIVSIFLAYLFHRENAGDNGEQMNEAEKVLSRERELERAAQVVTGLDGYSPHKR